MTKKILGIPAACILLATAVWAKPTGYRIVYDVSMTKGTQTRKMESKYYLQGDSVRFETADPAQPTQGGMVMIRGPQTKGFVLVVESQKSYLELPSPDANEVKALRASRIPFKATGRRKKIAGYTCEVFERTIANGTEETCAAKELNDVYTQFEKAVGTGVQEDDLLPGGLNGFPVEYIVKAVKTQPRVEMQMKELKRETLDASLFLFPKEYKKLDASTFGMATGGKSPAKPAPMKK